MTLSGIWDSYFYDASHTIRESGCYINTIKIEYLSLVCTLATRLSTSVILRFVSSFVFTTGYDPITFCVSDKRSTNWATWTIMVEPGGLEPLPKGRNLQFRCRIRTTFSFLDYKDNTFFNSTKFFLRIPSLVIAVSIVDTFPIFVLLMCVSLLGLETNIYF